MKKYNPQDVENNIIEFWNKNNIYLKIKELCKGKKDFYFLDGPPYTSGKVHIGTAWNKALKDMVLRYKRMRRFNVFDRAGYDMHGLPTALAVQKKLNLKTKEAIEKYGIEKFIIECKRFCIEKMNIMNKDFKRLGVWMDFENAYQPIKQDFIDGEWMLIKTAHEKNLLYEGLRTMTWCPNCATALAKHECEYKEVTDDSIFVKFPVAGEEKKYLVIWTTTPWTIPFNLAIMVNPDLDYVEADVKGETWILSKALAGAILQGIAKVPVKILKEYKGERLKGMKYLHPFRDEIPHYKEIELEHPNLHTVVLSSEYVDTSAGTGLVHCAPGCGPEDYEVGVKNNLPTYNNIDQYGVFPKDMGIFAGKTAKKDDAFFIEELKKRGVLIHTTPVEHEYAHCWRCHSPVIFRTTKQWFFKVKDIKEKMIEYNNDTYWVPKAAYNAFHSWLTNIRDNSITKQRFWGTPLPIWRCDRCKNYVVIGSRDELKKHAKKDLPEDLHIPWIDSVTIPCECGGTKKRIPDVIDVWVDSGTTSWNALNYPKEKELFNRLFPADFILEGKDQIRGWFNLLLVSSMIAFDRPSFKNVYMHGFINDVKGRKMSKSLQNYILPQEVIKEYGADTLRYYTIGGANPAVDLNYNIEDAKLKNRNLHVLWNIHNLLIEMHSVLKIDLKEFDKPDLSPEDLYILSRLHSTILEVTKKMDAYLLNEVPDILEELYLDLSRKYIKFARDRIQHAKEKEKVMYVIFKVLTEFLKMFSIVSPFITEQIYQNLKSEFKMKEESIHMYEWPSHDDEYIDVMLEERFRIASSIISAALSIRDKKGVGIRWPLREIYVETKNEYEEGINELKDIILSQTNIKSLKFKKKDDYEKEEFIKGNVYLNLEMTEELKAEGYAREVLRRIQSVRRKNRLTKDKEISIEICAPDSIKNAVKNYETTINKKTNTKEITFTNDKAGEIFKIKGEEISIRII